MQAFIPALSLMHIMTMICRNMQELLLKLTHGRLWKHLKKSSTSAIDEEGVDGNLHRSAPLPASTLQGLRVAPRYSTHLEASPGLPRAGDKLCQHGGSLTADQSPKLTTSYLLLQRALQLRNSATQVSATPQLRFHRVS